MTKNHRGIRLTPSRTVQNPYERLPAIVGKGNSLFTSHGCVKGIPSRFGWGMEDRWAKDEITLDLQPEGEFCFKAWSGMLESKLFFGS